MGGEAELAVYFPLLLLKLSTLAHQACQLTSISRHDLTLSHRFTCVFS
jgi:hypothetical protein